MLEDEPMGWNESKLKLRRNETYNGLFVTYIPDLIFHGDGYTLINNVIKDEGICARVTVKIEYDTTENGQYRNLFTGFVKISDVKIDDEKCMITCAVEDSTETGLIQSRGKTAVRFDNTETIAGNAIDSGDISADYYIYPYNNNTTYYERKGYNVFDSIQYLLDYITDNGVTVVSDFFQTQTPTRQETTIQFNQADLPNSTLTYSFTILNYFNQSVSLPTNIQATVTDTLRYMLYTLNWYSTAFDVATAFHRYDMARISSASIVGNDSIKVIHDLPFGFGGSGSVGVIGVTTSSEVSDGMKHMFLTTVNQLCDLDTKVPEISFEKLFLELHKLFNLKCDFYLDGDRPTMRIEPEEYFLNAESVSIFVDDVIDKTRIVNEEFSIDTVAVGSRLDVGFGFGFSNPQSNINREVDWSTKNRCFDKKAEAKNEWVIDDIVIDTLIANPPTDGSDSNIVLLEGDDIGIGGVQGRTRLYESTGYSDVFGTARTYYGKNFHLTNPWKVKRWLNKFYGNPRLGGFEINNDREFNLTFETNFTCAMKFEDFKTVLNNRNKPIRFSSNNQTPIIGFIKEAEYDITKGKCKLTLLTQ